MIRLMTFGLEGSLNDMPTSEEILGPRTTRTVDFDDGQVRQIETEGVPMVDVGTGKPLILRTFEYAINPTRVQELKEKHVVISKQEIFNSHWPQIKMQIWADGLVASREVDPRVIIGKKRYRIFVLCEPKFRTLVVDKPKTLQEVFNKKQS